MKQNVFVTGADGMLGMSICRELISQGYHVKAFVLSVPKSFLTSSPDVEIVTGNVLDPESVERELAGCDFLIHCAALTSVWPRRSAAVLHTNLNGTRNVLEAAKKAGVKRMVHIGTASSFTPGSIDRPGDEASAYSGWKFCLDYTDSKYLAQQLLLKEYSENGFPVVILNPTYMLGPYDSGPSSGKMLIEILESKIFGYSPGGKNFVCSADVARAVVNSLRTGRTGECYIIGGENLSYREFFEIVCKATDKKIKLFKIPASLILVFGFISSAFARLTFTHPRLSFTMARFACVDQYYSSRKAEEELGYLPASIEKGINSCVDWFKSNGYLNGPF